MKFGFSDRTHRVTIEPEDGVEASLLDWFWDAIPEDGHHGVTFEADDDLLTMRVLRR